MTEEETIKELLREEVYTMENPNYRLMHVYINLKAEYGIEYKHLREGIKDNLHELIWQRDEILCSAEFYRDEILTAGYTTKAEEESAKAFRRMTKQETAEFMRIMNRNL